MYNSVWYENLSRPIFSPPNWVFIPVWTILYTTILVALVKYVNTKTSKNKNKGYVYFIIQLLLNFIWSPVFFQLKNIGFALIVIVFLDIFVYLTIKEFHSISKFAGQILIPYFLWVLFATYLNIGYFILN